MGNDVFIDIAAQGIGGRSELLYEPQPLFSDIKKCRLDSKTAEPIMTEKKMSTKDKSAHLL